MSVVSKPCRSARPGDNGRTGFEPVERLNGPSSVDAEHHSVLRRLEGTGQSHPRPSSQNSGVGRPHVALESMRLQARMLPGARDNRVLHAQLPAERSGGPVRRPVGGGRRVQARGMNARFEGRRQHGRLSSHGAGRSIHRRPRPGSAASTTRSSANCTPSARRPWRYCTRRRAAAGPVPVALASASPTPPTACAFPRSRRCSAVSTNGAVDRNGMPPSV